MKLLPKWEQCSEPVLPEEGMSYAVISARSDPPVDGTDGRSLGMDM